MINLFTDDMQRQMYTDAFLSNVKYYISLRYTREALCEMLINYNKTSKISGDEIINIIKHWNNYARSRNYNCLPLQDFFLINDNAVRKAFDIYGSKYNIPSYGNETFFVNLYDIQKNLCNAGIRTVTKNRLKEAYKYNNAIIIDTYSMSRFVIKLVDNNKSSRYIVTKFRNSIGLFDTITYKMVAYKNFKTNKEYGGWNQKLEKELIAIYNIAVGIKKTDKESAKETKHTKQTNNNETSSKASKLLTNKLDTFSDLHHVDKIKIRDIVNNDISEEEFKLLMHYIEIRDLLNFESLAKRLYADAFIRLVNYKEINECNASAEADDFYYKLTGNRIIHREKKCLPRDREYRQQTKRGILVNSRGETIDGGNNRTGQSQINIKMNNTDFNILCNMFGIVNPNQSELNGIVEDVLKAKFETYENFSLSDKAKTIVLYHRDKYQQSKINEYKACYIPCEYNAYITEIQKRNYKTENFKNSKTFVLSVILHEYIGYV